VYAHLKEELYKLSEPKECRELVGGVLQVGVIVIVMVVVVVVLVLGEGRKPQQPHKTQKHKTQDTRHNRETTKEESVFLRVRGIFRGSTCYLANYLRTLWLWL
jgi:cytoskeletal protein RodZ